MVNASTGRGWCVVKINNTSFLQEGGKVASSAASFLYAFESWRPMRQVQAVVVRRHDTLSLPWRGYNGYRKHNVWYCCKWVLKQLFLSYTFKSCVTVFFLINSFIHYIWKLIICREKWRIGNNDMIIFLL